MPALRADAFHQEQRPYPTKDTQQHGAGIEVATAGSDERAQDAEQRMTAQRIEADAAQAELRTSLTSAQASAAEARERAALLAGKLESSEAHSAALLARLDAITQPTPAKEKAKPKKPEADA